MSAAAQRTAASPYARRLARERGIPLERLAGTGPRGRIVAVDLASTIVAPVEEVAAPPIKAVVAAVLPAAIRATGSFAATIDLSALNELILASGSGLGLDPFLIKAAARAAAAHATGVRWGGKGAAIAIEGAAALAPSEIDRLRRQAAPAGSGGEALWLSRLTEANIRPIGAALPDGARLRLVVIAGKGAASAEALLVHDAEAVDEASAAAILAAFRDLLEAPLRLLV